MFKFNPLTGKFDLVNPGGGSGSPAWPFTSIQFNDGGAFGGALDGIFDKTVNNTRFGFGVLDINNLASAKVSIQQPVAIGDGNVLDITNIDSGGYSVNEVLTILGGNNDATFRVDSVDENGGILTFTIITPGTGYLSGTYGFNGIGEGQGDIISNLYIQNVLSLLNEDGSVGVEFRTDTEVLENGINNILIGKSAGKNRGIANYNLIGIGTNSLKDSLTDDAIALGHNTLTKLASDGGGNMALGNNVMKDAVHAQNNMGIGTGSLLNLTDGTDNVAIGIGAFQSATTASQTIAIGQNALAVNNGWNNVAIGTYAGSNNFTGAGNVFLGYYAGKNELGSNKLYISNYYGFNDYPLIYGEFDTGIAGFTNPTSGIKALFDTSLLTTSDKTFSFPNKSGKFVVNPPVLSITSDATPTINTDIYDKISITALATNITSMTTNLSGTPSDFDKLLFRIKDDGSPRSITWGASFTSYGPALPTTTTASKVLTVGFFWDAVAGIWACEAVSNQP